MIQGGCFNLYFWSVRCFEGQSQLCTQARSQGRLGAIREPVARSPREVRRGSENWDWWEQKIRSFSLRIAGEMGWAWIFLLCMSSVLLFSTWPRVLQSGPEFIVPSSTILWVKLMFCKCLSNEPGFVTSLEAEPWFGSDLLNFK